jgi:hypothetical protein
MQVISSICNLKMCHAMITLDPFNSVINLPCINIHKPASLDVYTGRYWTLKALQQAVAV